MNLNKKIILVTGGEGLIGKDIIKNIHSNNGIPISLDILNNNNLKKGKLSIDVNSDESISEVIEGVIKKYKRIDGLVNNAYPKTEDWGNKFEHVSTMSFSKNVDMQLSRVFAISKPVLEIMKKQNFGSIVNIASIYGIVGSDVNIYKNTKMSLPPAYSAIKGGLISFNRYISSYFGEYGIRANCISPGGVFNNQEQVFIENYTKKVPLKRMAMPEDISPAVTFLLSDLSKYITGQNIAIDGGYTII
jgi:NAD(P)-dependent dehydrogenase (short-subunit alcohol dehydrogenase family)